MIFLLLVVVYFFFFEGSHSWLQKWFLWIPLGYFARVKVEVMFLGNSFLTFLSRSLRSCRFTCNQHQPRIRAVSSSLHASCGKCFLCFSWFVEAVSLSDLGVFGNSTFNTISCLFMSLSGSGDLKLRPWLPWECFKMPGEELLQHCPGLLVTLLLIWSHDADHNDMTCSKLTGDVCVTFLCHFIVVWCLNIESEGKDLVILAFRTAPVTLRKYFHK